MRRKGNRSAGPNEAMGRDMVSTVKSATGTPADALACLKTCIPLREVKAAVVAVYKIAPQRIDDHEDHAVEHGPATLFALAILW